MAHSLIVGMTESGKTTLAKKMVKQARDANIIVIILDPMQDPDWYKKYGVHRELVFADKNSFMDRVKTAQCCHVYVDEAGSFGKFNEEIKELATQGRHFGHSCTFITQRYKQLDTTVRAQCSIINCFTMPLDDGIELSKDYGHPQLRDSNQLKQFEYYRGGRYIPLKKYCLQNISA